MKRTFTIGMLALVLAVGAVRTSAACKLVSSARDFGRQFHALKGAKSISPLERIVLSLASS